MPQVHYNMKEGIVEIHLSGTAVTGTGNPAYGEGLISLTAYGAKKLAYDLLDKATDADHYEDKRSSTKTMEWKDIPQVQCNHSNICPMGNCQHAEPHEPEEWNEANDAICSSMAVTCNCGSDGDVICKPV